jgi:hypothetical protein
MEAIQVFRYDFNNMENRNAEYAKLLGTFIEKDGLTAHGNASKYIEGIEPMKMYLGWDGEAYPKLRLVKIQIS